MRLLKFLILFLSIFLIISGKLFSQAITNSIVVGGVTSNSARFWVRVSESAEINIELSTTALFHTSILGLPVTTTKESDFSGIVNVSGLQPKTKYFYRALVNNQNVDNAERSFTTFPEPGEAGKFQFAFGSCQQSGSGPTLGDVYKEIVKHHPDFFLQLGDWGYPDSTDNIPLDNNFFSENYSTVQQIYLNRFSTSYPMDSLFKIAPVDYVYDDHDFMNDNCSAATSSFFIPYKPNSFSSDFFLEEVPNPENARTNSIKGYKENMPGYDLPNESRGIYHKFTYGNTEIFALDLRSQRSPNLESFIKDTMTGLWEFNPPQAHSILGSDASPGNGESQLDWFLNSLKNSTSEWKFIMSSVTFNRSQSKGIELGMALQNIVLNIPFENYLEGITGFYAALKLCDKWVGFPSDIDTVLHFININNIKNVIILSGDSHNAAIDDGLNAGLPEIMAGGLDIPNSKEVAFFESVGIHIWDKGGQGITTQNFNNSFGMVSVYGNDSVNLALVDETGKEFAAYTLPSQNLVSVRNNNSEVKSPGIFLLCQNYPNPFNPSTTISYSISKESRVNILITNIIGQKVAGFDEGVKSSGEYKIFWKPEALASGVYFCVITAESKDGRSYQRKLLKMLLIK